MNTNKLNSKFKLPLSLVVLVLVCILMLSFAFADVNGGTYAQRNGAGAGNNFEWGGDLDSQLYDHYTSFTSNLYTNTPVVCDIDKDGKQEIIVADGNLIQVWGKTEQNQLVIESSWNLIPRNGTTTQINSMACVRFFDNTTNDNVVQPNVLAFHQGINTFSASQATFDNNIMFVEYQPLNSGSYQEQVFYDLNNSYQLVGVLENASNIYGGEFACDGFIPNAPHGIEQSQICLYANPVLATTFYKPLLSEFRKQLGQSGVAKEWFISIESGSLNRKLMYESEAQLASRYPQQNWAFAVFKDGVRYAHFFMSDTTVFPYTRHQDVYTGVVGDAPLTFVTDALTDANMITTGNMQLLDVQTFDDINDNRVCLSSSNKLSGASGGNSALRCATAHGIPNVYAETRADGTRSVSASAYGRYDYNLDGTNDRLSYFVVDGKTDVFLPQWAGYSQATDINQTYAYNLALPMITGVPFSIFASHYEHEVNATILLVGNRIVKRSTNGTYSYKGEFPHSPVSYLKPLDLDNDFKLELMAYEPITGNVFVYIQEPDTTPTPETITLINTAILGDGYFGYYNNSQCASENVTFKALECIGGITDCTYTSTDPISQERLWSTCGGTTPLFSGPWSFTTPSIECDLAVGNYNVTLSIESTADPGNLQGTNFPPIPINVINGVVDDTCNVITDQYNVPSQLPIFGPEDPVDPGEGPGGINPPTADPETQPVTYLFQLLFGNVPPAVKFILTIAITLGMAVLAHNTTGGNQFIVSLAGAMGVGLSVILTLLAIETAIVGVIIFVIVAFVHHKFQHPTLSS